jgi:hypothetical protein
MGAGKSRLYQEESSMQKSRLELIALCVFILLLSVAASQAAPQTSNFVGAWTMTMASGGHGGGGDEGGATNQGAAGEHHGGPQSLTITQNGDKLKVSHKTKRGENVSDAVISGNTISWTEERQGRDGNTMKITFKATLSGDTINGTVSGGQFNRDFSAKRST